MAQALEFPSGQIEALIRAMSVAKIIREDRDPCMIEEVLDHESYPALFSTYTYLFPYIS